MDSEKQSFKILMFPWLAHGHIFPYLELAKRIIKRKNFHIYFCSSAINFSSINTFIAKNLLHNSIELVELHLPQWPELPPHYHTTKNLPPNLMPSLHMAFQASKSSFSDVLSTVKPDLLMYDMLQTWSPKLASSQGIPAVHFTAFSAASVSFFLRYYTSFEVDCPYPEICFSEHEKKNLDEMMEFMSVTVCSEDPKDGYFISFKLSSDIVLIKTSMVFEKKFIDYISADSKKRLVRVGPLVSDASDANEEENSEIIPWLNKKDKHSTVYISFGSESFLSREEIGEIAKGLEFSNVNFIWVIRFPIEENVVNVKAILPSGFLDRVKDRGMIVEGWAPQANILTHSSTGGFLSHCGWSSINESVYFGVPIIGMPLKINMFIDARMAGEAGVCLEVARDESGVFRGEEIGKAINKVIVEKKGDEMRRRARELSEKMRVEEEEALDETANELWRLCMKKN